MRKVFLLAGLGYGDEGKGATCDYLARRYQASLIVRYNGGGQTAHNVVSGSQHHTFAQFGSGTFAGAKTLLSRFMLVNPITLMAEGKSLEEKGVKAFDSISVEREAVITTPFHMAANRLKELGRGKYVHGSCGMGIGETRYDELHSPDRTIRVKDISNTTLLLDKLYSIQRHHRKESNTIEGPTGGKGKLAKERDMLSDPVWVERTAEYFKKFRYNVNIVDEGYLEEELKRDKVVIFEGAQGVLLDQDYGFQPHTTWTSTTFSNADVLLQGKDIPVERLGIVRAYMTRHGAGPLITEDPRLELLSRADHNTRDEWQGNFRTGATDLVMLRYAKEVIGHLDGLIVNHLDRYNWNPVPFADAYILNNAPDFSELYEGSRDEVRRLIPPTPEEITNVDATFSRQISMTQLLKYCYPDYSPGVTEGKMIARLIAQDLKVPLRFTATGPESYHRQEVDPSKD